MSLSGGRESLLTREVKDLKTKLTTKTDELNKAVKRNSEVMWIYRSIQMTIFRLVVNLETFTYLGIAYWY